MEIKLTSLYEYNEDDENEIDKNLINYFFFENEIPLLEKLGMNVETQEQYCSSLFKKIDRDYNKETSINYIRSLFREWSNEKTTDKRKKEITSKLNRKNLISQNDEFLDHINLNVGEFYTGKKDFEFYSDFSISNKYFMEGSKLGDWVLFFTELALWTDLKNTHYMLLNKEQFLKMPFISETYKTLNEACFVKKNSKIWFPIDPEITHIFDQQREKIKRFFDSKVKYCIPPTRKSPFSNYFKWIVCEKNKFPTNKGELLGRKDIYSFQILKRYAESSIEQEFIKQTLNFPIKETIEESLLEKNGKSIFQTKLSQNSIEKLLDDLYQQIENSKKGRVDSPFKIRHLKLLYKDLILEYSQFPNAKYSGFFIDCDSKFRKPEEMYLILDKALESTILTTIQRKYKNFCVEEYVRDKLFEKTFIKFLKNSNLRVYEMSTMKYTEEGVEENKDIKNIVEKLVPHFSDLQIKNGLPQTDIKGKIKKLKFYSCSQIYIETPYGENFNQGIAHYRFEGKQGKQFYSIYFLKDDVYDNWKHPTIVYFIAIILAKYLDCEKLSGIFQPLLLSKNKEEVEAVIKNN
jgi:hypothetical protein